MPEWRDKMALAMNYFSRILPVLIFALLQCVAPLVHAHVDGQLSGILPPSLTAQYHTEPESAGAICSIEEYESPAISIPHEYQRDDFFAIAPPLPANILSLPRLTAVKHASPVAPAIVVLSPYDKSHPQAPPVLV